MSMTVAVGTFYFLLVATVGTVVVGGVDFAVALEATIVLQAMAGLKFDVLGGSVLK